MIGLLQRVSQAQVEVNKQLISRIDTGLLVFIGIEQADATPQCQRMLQRLLNYRVFPDIEGKMNLSLLDIKGELLLVPQFTLAADTSRGNRASFSKAATPEVGKKLFHELVSLAKQENIKTGTGEFGADMQISLTNDGPVTFLLHV